MDSTEIKPTVGQIEQAGVAPILDKTTRWVIFPMALPVENSRPPNCLVSQLFTKDNNTL